jgi:hypothetical protein
MMNNRVGIPFVLSFAVALSYATESHAQSLPTIRLDGTTSGIFTNPTLNPNGDVTGRGTSVFTWGTGISGSPPNRLTFSGLPFQAEVVPIVTFGSTNRNNRSVFPIGTLSYFNGTVAIGTEATSVQLDNTVQYTNASLTGLPINPQPIPITFPPVTFSSQLNLTNTPNTGTPLENADIVSLPNNLPPVVSIPGVVTPIILPNNLISPLSLKPIAFGRVQGSGVATQTEFKVFEGGSAQTGGGTATADLLARLAPACEPIVNGAVNVNTTDTNGDGVAETILATFTPNFGLNLSQAANLCGYDHFNWYQKVTNDPHPPGGLSVPYTDPPPGGGPAFGGFADDLPFYWDEQGPGGGPELSNGYNLGAHTTPATLDYTDTPTEPGLQPGQFLGFNTSLVGVLADQPSDRPQTWDLLYDFTWKSNFNGTRGGVSRPRSIEPADPNGTGGIFDLRLDLNPEDIPEEVRELMEADGARNASVTLPAQPTSVPEPSLISGLGFVLSAGFLLKRQNKIEK